MDGHSVVNTVDGQEALDLLKIDRAFDIVLMDLQYGYSSFEFCRLITIVLECPSSTDSTQHELSGKSKINLLPQGQERGHHHHRHDSHIF